MGRFTLAGLGVSALLVGVGCPVVGVFACDSAGDCDREGGGVCLPSGDCAYPDDACDSGLRRSAKARARPGECVESTAGSSSTGPVDPSSSTGPSPCGWRRTIDVDTTLLSATESWPGYPLLIALSDPQLLSATAPDGGDLYFTAEDGQPLPHELDTLDPSTGRLLAWVRLPSWTPGQPLRLVLRGGEPTSAPDPAPSAVWDEVYLGVWHLDDALSGSDDEVVRDSTVHAEHGFTAGGMAAEQVVAGQVGAGLAFDGDDDSVTIPGSFVGNLDAFTVTLWGRVDDNAQLHGPYFQRLNGDNLYPRCRKLIDESEGGLLCQIGVDQGTVGLGVERSRVPLGEFKHIALRWDPESRALDAFVDGQLEESSEAPPGPLDGGTLPLGLGRVEEFNTLLGVLDEFRVAGVVLPDGWIMADYRTQVAPTNTLLAVGSPEPASCP